jgi:hypothetical protein
LKKAHGRGLFYPKSRKARLLALLFDVNNLFAVIITAFRADMMGTDLSAAIGAGDSIRGL